MKYIGIVVAMEEEGKEIIKLMNKVKEKEIDGLKFVIGKIENKNCVLVQSGVGKVNAARTTQVLIYKFNVEMILNVGSAGAINDELNIGDVIIGKHIVQHDFDITAFDHPKGYITGIGDNVSCSNEIINKIEKVINENKNREYKTKVGIIATGDVFLTDLDMKQKIKSEFNADVIDMESGAIAQVAYLNKIPFGAIRSVSDTPNGNNANTFDENLELASKRAANLLKEYLKN